MRLVHVMNHAVERRELFCDDADRLRFIHNLYEFNSTASAEKHSISVKKSDLRGPILKKKLVSLHAWVLMKDHYHLLLSDRVEGGIVKFMTKLNVGYAKYYNERYERTGFVFRGKTKKVLVERNEHLLYLFHYIHFNPLDYLAGASAWRVRSKDGVRNTEEAMHYLEQYRWSSFLDYCGSKNFPSVLDKSLLTKVLTEYKKDAERYLREAEIAKNGLWLE